MLLSPIVLRDESLRLSIRDFSAGEVWLVAHFFSVTDIDGSLLPITVPRFRVRSVRDVRLLFVLEEVEVLVELTAGCWAPDRIEELLAPIVLPIRERWLVVVCLFAFEAGGVLRLLEPLIREAPFERAAGCSAPLGTDGLVVSIVLPIREAMLGLIRLLVLVVDLFVVAVRVLLLSKESPGLLDGVLVLREELPGLIELPIIDVMLELIRPFELSTGRLTVLRLLAILRLDWLDLD